MAKITSKSASGKSAKTDKVKPTSAKSASKPAASSKTAGKATKAHVKPAPKPVSVAKTPAKAAPAKVASKPTVAKPAATKAVSAGTKVSPPPLVSTGPKVGSGPKPGSMMTAGSAPTVQTGLNPPPLPPAPITTSDTKTKKNSAGLSSKELEFFRDLLLAKRRELVGDMRSMEADALLNSQNSGLSSLPVHMADMGTDNYEQEFTLGLVEKDRLLLREINVALAKIAGGSYGICEGTGQPISKPRLEAQPWARHSIEYARALEKRKMRF